MTILDRLAAPLLADRLAAVAALAPSAPQIRRGTNVHVHSNHSFSVFRSPSEAAWAGAAAGVEVIGINDFFTTAGMAEFAQAAAAARIPAAFGIECIALDAGMAARQELANDPANPGKIYLTGKGVTSPDSTAAQATLAGLRASQEARNRALIAKADAHFRATVGQAGPSWQDVVGQTPAGNTTERHVAKAILARILALGGDVVAAYTTVVGAAPKAGAALTAADPDAQNQIRGNLLKTGKPCYAPEDPAAFPDVAAIRALFLQLGAIPTYPVLGNPITDGEKDLGAWCDRVAGWGFFALELIPSRNTDERMQQVIDQATRRGWLVCDGTEHNTPAMEPLTTRWGLDDRFRPRLREGALVILGHQALRAAGKPGYVDAAGALVPGGYAACLAAGERQLAARSAAAG